MNYALELKHALRIWLGSWGHSTLSITVVALSLGLTLWAYALVYGQALQPLGFPDSDRWYSIQVSRTATESAEPAVDSYTYQKIVEQNPSLDHLGAFSARSASLSEADASVSLRAADISPRLLAETGERPMLGRLFEENEGEADAAPVVLLSFDSWQTYFGGDPDIVGRQTTIGSQLVRIVGVMPEDFFAFQDFELWMPLHIERLVRPDASDRVLTPFISLRDGQDPARLEEKIQAVVDDINRSYPALFDPERKVELIRGRLIYTHSILHVVAMIALLALAILLLACVNISLIFLARLLERSRELALRSAIGASRGRLMGQCLAETGLIILVGLVLGYGLAMLGVHWAQGMVEFTSQIQARGRAPDTIELRAVDVLVAIIIAIIIWLLSTLVPAWRIAQQDAATVLAGTGKGSAAKGNSRTTNLLVGLQVLVSSVVLVVCVNLVVAINQEAGKPMGIELDRVMVTTKPSVFDEEYNQPNRKITYWDDLKASIGARIPGAEVAYSTAVPIQPDHVAVGLETEGGSGDRGRLELPVTAVSEDYFDMLGIGLLHGRLFDSTDNANSRDVAVIDQKTADRYWPGQTAIGKRIQIYPSEGGPWLNVVGIVSGVSGAPYRPDIGVIYRPLDQARPEAFHTLVKLPPNFSSSRAVIRAAAFEVDREMSMNNIQALDDYLAVVYLGYRSIIPVLGAITIITVVLAATGLFGLISRSVAQRTQEVGIRRALGANRPQSISMFFQQGGIYLIVALFGMGIGIIFTNFSSAVFTNALDSVVLVISCVLILFLLVIFFSAYFPARRALRLEPGDALRYE